MIRKYLVEWKVRWITKDLTPEKIMTLNLNNLSADVLKEVLPSILPWLKDVNHPFHEQLLHKIIQEVDPYVIPLGTFEEWNVVPWHEYMDRNILNEQLLLRILAHKCFAKSNRDWMPSGPIITKNMGRFSNDSVLALFEMHPYYRELVLNYISHDVERITELKLWDKITLEELRALLKRIVFIEKNVPDVIPKEWICGIVRMHEPHERIPLKTEDVTQLRDKMLNINYRYQDSDIVFEERAHALWFLEVFEWKSSWEHDDTCRETYHELIVQFLKENVEETMNIDISMELYQFIRKTLTVQDFMKLDTEIQQRIAPDDHIKIKLYASLFDEPIPISNILYHTTYDTECNIIM